MKKSNLPRKTCAVCGLKFIKEVLWRGYFKGWLEQHPSVWSRYQSGLQTAFETLEKDAARKLETTGYLHNHARMWFSSIWIFTLRLSWELGADFFLRHLIDGDPAANTLSWRVVGLVGASPFEQSDRVTAFQKGAVEDAVKRLDPVGLTYVQVTKWAETIMGSATHAETKDVVTSWVPIGPTASHLAAASSELENASIHLHQVYRADERYTWPHAKKGLFKLKKKIRTILRELELLAT